MAIRMIATDMDGTFLNQKKGYDREAFRGLLEEMTAAGMHVVVASGGGLARISGYFDPDVRRQISFITDNGGLLLPQGQERPELTGFERDDYLAIIQAVQSLPLTHFYLSTGTQSYGSKRTPALIRRLEARLAASQGDQRIFLDQWTDLPADARATKLALMTPASPRQLARIHRVLDPLGIPMQVLTSGNATVDVIPATSGKGQALGRLQEALGISPAETAAFGDAFNDGALMGRAGFRLAMAAADPALVAACNYQIGSAEDGAVLTAIRAILDQGPAGLEEWRIR